MVIIYHRLINKDLKTALAYYEGEGGEKLADRFFGEIEAAITRVNRKHEEIPLFRKTLTQSAD